MRIIRRRPSPAMVVALIALFVALGGPAQARRLLIDGSLIRKGTVTGRAIKDHSVAKADLTKAAVKSLTATPANSVRSAQIADGQVLAPDLGANAVGSAQIAPGTVTASKLAMGSVGGGSVANGSLQTVDIGSFTGAISVPNFTFTEAQPCQAAEAVAAPAGGQPNIADDVVVVSQPASWPETVVVTGKPKGTDRIRIMACWVQGNNPAETPPDPGPTVFRYVTFDAP